jgi:hypothetical protein
MSKPSFSNIDLWLFEYAEGNLTPDQEAQLELFILQHPELDVDRDMWEMAKVKKQDTAYPQEEELIRRKPVAAYWGVGATLAVFTLLLFWGGNYFSLLHSEIKPDSVNHEWSFVTASGENVSDLTAHELELQQEIADLKALVVSLEGQLNRTRNGKLRKVEALQENETIETATKGTSFTAEVESRFNQNTEENAATLQSNGLVTGDFSVNSELYEKTTGNEVKALVTSAVANHTAPRITAMSSLKPGLLNEASHDKATLMLSSSKKAIDAFDGKSVVLASTEREAGIATNYDDSYRYKFAKLIRRVRRMANNPVALKNYRDPYHHVPGMSATDLNFGATGTMIAPRLQVLSRMQWYGQPNEMLSNQVAMDGYVYGLRGGIGVQMTHNYYNTGGIQSGEVAFTYSPKLSVNQKLSIEPAVRFKMGSKVLDADRMTGQSHVEMLGGNAIDYYTDGTTPVGKMLWYRDLGLGLNVNTEWFYASAQVDNIFRHKDNMYSNNLENKRRAGNYFVATIGTDWESNDSQWETSRSKFSLSPYIVYRSFEDINELWAGANFRMYWFTLGASISTNMDPAASLGVVSSDKRFSLMYNVDYMRSIMTNERSLSHQLTLRIVGKQSKGRRILNH